MLSGHRVNGFDILIAGTAVSRNASVPLTADTDFEVIAPVANLPVIRYRGSGSQCPKNVPGYRTRQEQSSPLLK